MNTSPLIPFSLATVALLFSLNVHPQSVTTPWNPDADENAIIGTTDLTNFLSVYGGAFTPEPVLFGTSEVEELILSLQDQVNALQSQISTQDSRRFLLRLEYTASNHLVDDLVANRFISASGFESTGAQLLGVNVNSSTAIYSVDVQFTEEENPPSSIMVWAWDPMTFKYEAHPYRVDNADFNAVQAPDLFIEDGGQWEGGLFGAFQDFVLNIDVRQMYIKYGNAVPFPPPSRLPHAFLVFTFD